MIKKVFGATLLIFLSFTYLFSQNQQQEQWVDSVFREMTLEQKIGQLIMIPVYTGSSEEHIQSVQQLITKRHVGGLVFMEGTPTRQVQLTNKFQESANIPLLIGMNMERGLGMRIDSTVRFPSPLALGAIENDSLLYALGQEISRQMKIMGVHLNIAPIADIYSYSKKATAGSGSFGSHYQEVTRKAVAYMKGLQENGVMVCAGHFPGDGDASRTSLLDLPEVEYHKSRLEKIELHPFRQLSHAGVAAIMSSNAIFSELDKRTPASLSEKVVNDLLRDQYKYTGIVITEALNSRAIVEEYGDGEPALQALQAGNDLLLFPQNIPEAIRLIRKNLKRKKISKSRFENSVKRILAAKYKMGLDHPVKLNAENVVLRLNHPDAAVLNHQLVRSSITVVKNEGDLLPFHILDNKPFASLSIGPSGDFTQYLNKYASFNHYDTLQGTHAALLRQLANYDIVVVGLFSQVGQPSPSDLDTDLLDLLRKLNEKTKVVVTVFGNPDILKQLKDFEHVLCAYENNSLTQKLVPVSLFGGQPVNGRLPVNISDQLDAGTGVTLQSLGRLGYDVPEAVEMDSRTLNRIDNIALEAVHERATPGCQVLVARNGRIIFERSYGFHTYDSIRPVTDQTIYDVASVTKVMATMQAFMFLEERGLVDLDKKISVYLPELKGTNKEHMIIRDVLTHQAGLWPYLPFWKRTLENSLLATNLYKVYPVSGFEFQVSNGLFTSQAMQDSVWQWVKNSRIREKTYRKPYDYMYSDLGYYILQRMIENIINQPMEQFLRQNFYDPMGLSTTTYLPLCKFPLARIAPTERDDNFRKSLVYGMVHDEGAALCGGIAGHAGLFSNAVDLAKMLQMHLQDGIYGGTRFFQPGTIKKFTSRQYETNRRGIGWDKPLIGESGGPTSEFASAQTFGHTGFTGTAIWADPKFDLIYIFLSNRIHPDASNTKLIETNIRTRIQDIIYQSIWSYEQKYEAYKP